MNISRIQENISRQLKALSLLQSLLEEEFSKLSQQDVASITPIELSIQELMRQIVAERKSLKLLIQQINPNATRLHEILPNIEEEARTALDALLQKIKISEGLCNAQAEKNRNIVLALHEQSSKLVAFMQKILTPSHEKFGYSAKGQFVSNSSSPPTLMRGKL